MGGVQIWETKNKKSKAKDWWIKTAGMILVAALIAGNVWLAKKALSSETQYNLPKLPVNVLDAASVVVGRSSPQITWTEPHAILVLGQSGGNHISPDLTDSIFVLRVDPKKDAQPDVRIFSLPRDLLVGVEHPLYGELLLRANAVWSYAQSRAEDPVRFLKDELERIGGVKIDSVLIFDLATVEEVIKRIDGITVFVKDDVYDERFPSQSGGYEVFSLQRGWRYLPPKDAVRFVRTRATSAGDFDRIAHQQELIRALKGKFTSLNPVWDFRTLWSVFSIVKDNVVSDLTDEDIKNLWAVSERVGPENLKTMVLDTSSGLLTTQAIELGGVPADVLVPKEGVGEYEKIREAIKEFLISN